MSRVRAPSLTPTGTPFGHRTTVAEEHSSLTGNAAGAAESGTAAARTAPLPQAPPALPAPVPPPVPRPAGTPATTTAHAKVSGSAHLGGPVARTGAVSSIGRAADS